MGKEFGAWGMMPSPQARKCWRAAARVSLTRLGGMVFVVFTAHLAAMLLRLLRLYALGRLEMDLVKSGCACRAKGELATTLRASAGVCGLALTKSSQNSDVNFLWGSEGEDICVKVWEDGDAFRGEISTVHDLGGTGVKGTSRDRQFEDGVLHGQSGLVEVAEVEGSVTEVLVNHLEALCAEEEAGGEELQCVGLAWLGEGVALGDDRSCAPYASGEFGGVTLEVENEGFVFFGLVGKGPFFWAASPLATAVLLQGFSVAEPEGHVHIREEPGGRGLCCIYEHIAGAVECLSLPCFVELFVYCCANEVVDSLALQQDSSRGHEQDGPVHPQAFDELEHEEDALKHLGLACSCASRDPQCERLSGSLKGLERRQNVVADNEEEVLLMGVKNLIAAWGNMRKGASAPSEVAKWDQSSLAMLTRNIARVVSSSFALEGIIALKSIALSGVSSMAEGSTSWERLVGVLPGLLIRCMCSVEVVVEQPLREKERAERSCLLFVLVWVWEFAKVDRDVQLVTECNAIVLWEILVVDAEVCVARAFVAKFKGEVLVDFEGGIVDVLVLKRAVDFKHALELELNCLVYGAVRGKASTECFFGVHRLKVMQFVDPLGNSAPEALNMNFGHRGINSGGCDWWLGIMQAAFAAFACTPDNNSLAGSMGTQSEGCFGLLVLETLHTLTVATMTGDAVG
ncbi:hypothetical protein BDK51DRAFT_29069, partial [Blyttiomyces helicus]